MKIAKIVSSNSHIDYVARVIDRLDVENPPTLDDYGFGNFVSIKLADKTEFFGIIYNSMLMNPDYANYGPRLSPSMELSAFSPDFINEQGCLIAILLLGSKDPSGKVIQNIPHCVVSAGCEVFRASDENVKNFHIDEKDELQIHYYSQIVAHTEKYAIPLIESIIEKLCLLGCTEEHKKRLDVLLQTLRWQRTIGGMRL